MTQRARPSAGRPTREQAERRRAQLLDRALDVFLESGYELATIEAIRNSIGMTKRTIYGLYADKRALFQAALQRAIERWIVPVEALRALESEDLPATLTAIARLLAHTSISPTSLKLARIINAEAHRTPEITLLAYEQGAVPCVRYVTELLVRHAKKGEIRADEPELLAHGFLRLAVGGPTRGIILVGAKIDQDKLDRRISFYVQLFLDGVRSR